jgi:mannose-1-phosphate guanylyltransferase
MIGPGAVIESSVLLDGVVVGRGAVVSDSVLGPGSRLGAAAVLHGVVVAAGVDVPGGARPAPGARLELS